MSYYDPLDIQSHEDKKLQSELQLKLDNEAEEEDIKWLMQSKRGRRVIWRLLEQAGVFRLSFRPDAMQMSFAEGQRNSGLRILALVHDLCADLYPVMIKEHVDERNSNSREP